MTTPSPAGPLPEPPAQRPPADRPRYRALVVTASQRAAAGVYPDKGGPLLADGLSALGFLVEGPLVVPDGEPVGTALREAVAAAYDVVVTTGGTGISPTDRTPEMTRAVLDYEIPGIPEALRAEGLAKVPTAALSRGLAGVAGTTLIINLPGSSGGVRDGLAVLGRLLVHAVDQLRGGDHARPAGAAHPAAPGEPSGLTGQPAPAAPAGPPAPDAQSRPVGGAPDESAGSPR
ncbi:MogA/MoaB family molybdenum cofactor biosynthesis protein [Streptomyces sp. 71268]|uniref:MogA/MoaB family molybdenum cofactor biosynthesis protein n=1 Tax=Streptomyces sp. 71268 TaxID=3002640 RepID=UPI0023F93633|nr:MogA/MoaB family molybdenum cofactor biosynthesis protein [Streptomyces sp. 71268]WEV25848.1 MogA/MoaB family molybdenum cofactor biosynthesis protein [Streptomyces sp. 71268]